MALEFLYGPSYTPLQAAAFERADRIAGDAPRSIYWLEQNDHRTAQVGDSWAADHDPLRLAVTSLDQLVGECYETVAGPSTILDALTRRQLVEQALRTLAADGVLADAHRYRDEVLELFTTLEAEEYATPEAIRALVAASDLPSRAANVVTTTYTRFADNRETVMTDDEYTGSQAYQAVRDAEAPLASLVPGPATDVIVLSGYYELSASDRAIIECMARDCAVLALLPLVSSATAPEGADAIATETAAYYRELADEVSHITPDGDPTLRDIASRLYTPATAAGEAPPEATLRWVAAPTPDREIRQVARAIRDRLATDGVSPEDILVVVPGLISYREHVEDIFPAHGIEAGTFANKLLYQTYAGDAMLDLVAACEEPPGAGTLARLATNPMVTLGDGAGATVADLARRLPTDDHKRLLAELDPETRAAVTAVLEKARAVREARGVATIGALRALFEHVGLEDAVNAVADDATTFDARMESRAYRRVERALDAIERVARTLEVEDVLARVRDELDQLRVPPPQSATDGAVEVVGPRDAFMQSYDHLYLVGLTAQDFPPDPERPRFFETLEAGLDGIETTSDRAEAQYQFATMLASAESVYITTPETTADDDPLLESPILDELARVTDLEPTTHDLGNGSREDVQRAIGRARPALTATEAVEQSIAAGVFEGDHATRVRRGVTCAQHRASPARTAHDGLLARATVEALHPSADREPYSPTQLTQYARCGFQYYMERVLGIEAPEEYQLEPDPLDLGSLVHAILAEFYTTLQDAPGEPVALSQYDRDTLEERMLAAGERTLERMALPFDDAFFDRWLEALFAGLATPERNPYAYTDGAGVHDAARGVLARFLDAERDREAAPGWFEVGMDLGAAAESDGTFALELADGRTISIGGRIDRVTVDHSETPPTGLVHDYKTGDRSPRLTVDGVEFQLPLYALAAGQALSSEDVATPLDAAFYVLDPPADVSEKWTLRYYLGRYADASDKDYTQFIESVTPERVGTIVDSIQAGAFQPTVLDADTAQCRYCDYSDVCDVRYHQRQDVVDAIDADDRAGYVPQAARPTSLLDTLGGED